MISKHRVSFTARDLWAMIAEYMSCNGGDSIPMDAHIRLITQSTIKGQDDNPDLVIIEAEWGNS